MKPFIRMFFKALRIALGPFMLLWEVASRPRGVQRQPALQADIDLQCKDLALYQFRTCPFCLKVRQEMSRLSLTIERRDAQYDEKNRSDLLLGSGHSKVPCLKITEHDGKVQWLGGSKEIISYLQGRFANP